jgi:hypothetical protein
MEPPRGVPVSNPPRPDRLPKGFRGPVSRLSRQPTGARGQPGVSGAGARLCRLRRRRERPRRGRLEPGTGSAHIEAIYMVTVLRTALEHVLTCTATAKRACFDTHSAHAEPGGLLHRWVMRSPSVVSCGSIRPRGPALTCQLSRHRPIASQSIQRVLGRLGHNGGHAAGGTPLLAAVPCGGELTIPRHRTRCSQSSWPGTGD